jgi:hypothetical protein
VECETFAVLGPPTLALEVAAFSAAKTVEAGIFRFSESGRAVLPSLSQTTSGFFLLTTPSTAIAFGPIFQYELRSQVSTKCGPVRVSSVSYSS